MNENSSKEKKPENRKLVLQATIQFTILFILLGFCFFLPAGTIFFWEAWLFIGIFLVMMLFFLRFMVKNDPDLLRRRLERGEKRSKQKTIIKISNSLLIIVFLLPGLDRRWNWSSVPIWLIFLSDTIFALGYLMFFQVMKENSFASRTVQVDKNVQKVITTGPYSIVRHPMYTSVFIMFGIMPLALGSYWGMVILPILILMMIFRVRDEEKMLSEELEGYNEYKQKTKYRIIPFIW